MIITVVKKVKADGNLCRKSEEIWNKLKEAQLLSRIDRIIFVHENKTTNLGLFLAIKYQVKTAPFFIVEGEDTSTQVYTVYSNFLKEVLNYQVSESEEISEIMASNPELDLI